MSKLAVRIATIAALLLAIAIGTTLNGPSQRTSLPPVGSGHDSTIVWSHGSDGSLRNAEHHFQEHGREFPEFHSAREYEQGALAFVRKPPPGTLIKHRSNGDTLLYDPASNTFAVADRKGEPRTFFRPDSGRRYWDRQ